MLKKVYVNNSESRVIKELKNKRIAMYENVTQFECLIFLQLRCMCYF